MKNKREVHLIRSKGYIDLTLDPTSKSLWTYFENNLFILRMSLWRYLKSITNYHVTKLDTLKHYYSNVSNVSFFPFNQQIKVTYFLNQNGGAHVLRYYHIGVQKF